MASPEEGDCYFYTKSITALSKLSLERLPATCWTGLKMTYDDADDDYDD